jgi:hypothetical protein
MAGRARLLGAPRPVSRQLRGASETNRRTPRHSLFMLSSVRRAAPCYGRHHRRRNVPRPAATRIELESDI